MKTLNEQVEQLNDMQKRGLEPLQKMSNVTAQAFERIARQNYEMMGDLVDYAVAQVQIPANQKNAQEILEHQMAETRAFAEKINSRANEYMELVGQLGELASDTATASIEPLREAASEAIENAKAQTAENIEQLQHGFSGAVAEASKAGAVAKPKAAVSRKKTAAKASTKKTASRKKASSKKRSSKS